MQSAVQDFRHHWGNQPHHLWLNCRHNDHINCTKCSLFRMESISTIFFFFNLIAITVSECYPLGKIAGKGTHIVNDLVWNGKQIIMIGIYFPPSIETIEIIPAFLIYYLTQS